MYLKNSLDVLKSIYENNNHIQVIMLNSNIDLNSIQKAYEYGYVDYLKKPFHVEELRLKIKHYIKGSENLLNKVILKENEILTKMEKHFLSLLLKEEKKIVKYSSIDSLRTLVRRLRKKLLKDSIENIIGEGYRCGN